MQDSKISKNVVFKSLFWKLSERFFSQIMGLVVQIILARILLPKDFGSLAIIASIISYLGIFVQSGLSASIIQKKNLDKKDVSTLLSISMIISLVVYCFLFFISPIISSYYEVGDLTWPLRALALNLFLSAINSIQTGLLARQMKFKTLFMRSVVAIPLSGIIGITLAYYGFGLWALVIYALSNTLIVVIFMNMVPELRIKLEMSWARAKELYSFSIKILLTHLVSGGGDTIRTMSIGKFYNPSNLAFYDKGYTYSRMATDIITSSISGVLLPTFSRSQDDLINLKNICRKSVKASSFAMIPLLTILILIAYPLILIMLTSKWLPCAPFLVVFCLLRMPGCVTSIDKQIFLAVGKSHISLYYEIGILVAILTMLYITIPMGILYIAIGATFVEYLGSFTIFLITSKVIGYRLKERILDMWRPICNSLIVYFVVKNVALMGLSSILTIFIQVVSALALYILLAFITKDENIPYLKELVLKRGKK